MDIPAPTMKLIGKGNPVQQRLFPSSSHRVLVTTDSRCTQENMERPYPPKAAWLLIHATSDLVEAMELREKLIASGQYTAAKIVTVLR